jgi:hemerythrin
MKELISWTDKLSVTVGSIDQQHKQLVQMVNELNAAIGEGKADAVIGDILKRLINYTASHFAHEENLMRSHSYPGYDKHHKEHETLVAKVLDLQKKFESGQARMNIEVMMFLKNWLTNHIQVSDKALGAYLSTKKVA